MTLSGPVMSTMGGVEKLSVFLDDMGEPCLLRLDSLFRKAPCEDLGRMLRQVREKAVPLILENAAEQVEPRDELRCRGGETADALPSCEGGDSGRH